MISNDAQEAIAKIQTYKPAVFDLIPICIEACKKDILDIMNSLTEGDLEKVARSGHNMEGVGAFFGIEFIHKRGLDIKMSAKKEDYASVRKDATEILSFLGHIEKVLPEERVK
ncbi:MAG: hypothetical protein KAV87_64030 [Desulfobacteraceae bacterium]|nr:hypothetical protein [Desulfobacteraceae bacterium]